MLLGELSPALSASCRVPVALMLTAAMIGALGNLAWERVGARIGPRA